ncbi:unnamed protein product [Linum trigynum]|uniref:Uncharacterized protein n=1 Tax=Linum trigynum TaxID=586398 RepID=A0AAV2CSR1_9ROSI
MHPLSFFSPSPALISRASTATIEGAFNFPKSSACKTLKRAKEDHNAVKKGIRSIEEGPCHGRPTTNEGITITEEDLRDATIPPPKPPEQRSIRKQQRKSSISTKGSKCSEIWKVEEAIFIAISSGRSQLIRAT